MKTQLQLEFPAAEIKVGDVIWKNRPLKGGKGDVELWISDYYSADGDNVSCYIQPSSLNLQCFSGIPASCIVLDKVDYECVWRKTKHKDEPMFKFTFQEQSLILADYFCSLHCELIITDNYK